MEGVGDCERITDGKSKHSIDDLKKICIDKGYSGFGTKGSEPSFDGVWFKKFGFQLEKKHLAPCHDGEQRKFYFHSTKEKVKFKWMAFPTNLPLTHENAK